MVKKKASTNPWIIHVNKVRKMKVNEGKPLKEILKIAKATYKKKKK